MKLGWTDATLGQVVEPITTVDPNCAYKDATFTYVDLSAVDRELKRITATTTQTGATAPSRARQVLRAGDVLVSTVRPNLNAVAVVEPDLDGAIGSTGFTVLRPSSKLDARYLFHWVRTPEFVSQMVRQATGASYPAVSDRIVKAARIPLPALDEQRRIARTLDAAEALRAKRRVAIAQLDKLIDSIFLGMFGDPVTNPRGWPNPTLGGLLTFQQYGPRFHNARYSADGIRIIRITDLNDAGDLDFARMPRLTVAPEDRAKYALRPGDLIFARTGATVGKVALISPNDPACIAGAYFITMRFDGALEPRYARAVLTSPSVRTIIATRSRQSAQQNFSGPALRRLPMPLPSSDLQRRFVSCTVAVKHLRAAYRASLARLDALSESLQYRAFDGTL